MTDPLTEIEQHVNKQQTYLGDEWWLIAEVKRLRGGLSGDLDRLDAEIDQWDLGQSESFRLGEHNMILRVRRLITNEP